MFRTVSITLASMFAFATPLPASAGKLPDLKKFSRVSYAYVHLTHVRTSGGFYAQARGSHAYSMQLEGRANLKLYLKQAGKRPDFKASGLPVAIQIAIPTMHAYAATSWLRNYLAECSQAALAALQGRLNLLVQVWGAASLGTMKGAANRLVISVQADPAHLERMFCSVFEPAKTKKKRKRKGSRRRTVPRRR